ncbi:MAG: AMP-binding protein [Clostridiaceae bacterium]|nr:AMP-binding protein [Clostridiaceae bacterium]
MQFESLCEVIKAKGCMEDKGIIFINGENDEEFVSYKELYNNALGILGYLQEAGVNQGNELLFQIDDNRAFVEIFWACLLGGIIPIPVTVGNNDEHKAKVFRIWETLKEPFLIINQKTLSLLEKYSKEYNKEKSFELFENRTVIWEEIISCGKKGMICSVKPEDIAFVQFSSGSTGEPKGVVLTHGNLLTNIYAIIKGCYYGESDATLSWMPLTHDMGLIGFHLGPLTAGTNQYIMPTSLFIRRPALWVEKLSSHKATVTSSPNFGYKYFLTLYKPETARDWDLSHVKLIFNGAEPISYDLCKEFLNTMSIYGLKENTMFNVYGLAEASLAVSFPTPGEGFSHVDVDRTDLSVGKKVSEHYCDGENNVRLVDLGNSVENCFIRICDDNDGELPENIVGHIQIKGRNVTRGYYNNEKATREVMTSDGWLRTGDLGFMRNGRLLVTGRVKDIIFVNGQNYYPHDIERVAEGIREFALGEIAACGIPNEKTCTDDIYLFVIYKKELKEFIPLALALKEHIGSQMGVELKEVVPVRKMPKTTSGKIQRHKFREMYLENEFDQLLEELSRLYDEIKKQSREFSSNSGKSGDVFSSNLISDELISIETMVLDIFRDVLGTDDIDVEDSFFNMGADSILLGRIYDLLLEKLSVRIALSDVFSYPTIKKLSRHIYNEIRQPGVLADKMKAADLEKELEYAINQMEKGVLNVEELAKCFSNIKGD